MQRCFCGKVEGRESKSTSMLTFRRGETTVHTLLYLTLVRYYATSKILFKKQFVGRENLKHVHPKQNFSTSSFRRRAIWVWICVCNRIGKWYDKIFEHSHIIAKAHSLFADVKPQVKTLLPLLKSPGKILKHINRAYAAMNNYLLSKKEDKTMNKAGRLRKLTLSSIRALVNVGR